MRKCLKRALSAAVLVLLGAAATAAPVDEPLYANLPNFHRVDEHLLRGGQPGAGGVARLKALGVRTIVKEGEDPEAGRNISISLVAASRWMDEWRDKSDAQFFAHALQQVLAILTELDESGETKDPFWSVVALPYFREALAASHLEAMAYSTRRSLKEPGSVRWLADHAEAVDKFQAWPGAWKSD